MVSNTAGPRVQNELLTSYPEATCSDKTARARRHERRLLSPLPALQELGVEDPILQMGTPEAQIPQNDCTLLTNYAFTAKTTKEFESGVQKEPSWTSRWRYQVRITDPGVRDVLKGGCHRS